MTIDTDGFCNKVVTIPQFTGTCWFNAILMSLLYSQHSRKLLLHDNIYEKQKSTNKLYKIINKILLDHYISRKKAMKYYNVLRPQKIIKSYLPNMDEMNKKYMLKRGWFFYIYLPKFLTILEKSCMTLDKYKGEYYINLLKIFEYYKQSLVGNNVKLKILSDYKKLLEEKGNPDYLIVNLLTNNDIESSIIFESMLKITNYEYMLTKDPKLSSENMKLKNSGKRFKGLKHLEKVIEYNGDTYVLDSCIIANYNKTLRNNNHAICGITCKNNKYVYNGWIRATNDPAIVDKSLFKDDNMPCELMKFDWDVSNPHSKFCLNPARCKLPTIDKTVNNDMCFSFGKGKRTLIYVKTNKDFKSLDENLKSSPKKTVKKTVMKTVKDDKKTVKKTVKDDKKTVKKTVMKTVKDDKKTVMKTVKDDKKTVKKTVKDDKKTVMKTVKTDKKKECPEGKILNPSTGRCIKIKTVKDVKKKECPEGKVLNPLTGRCIKIKTVKDDKKKECPEGKILNPLTGRCIKIKK
jgi:hypothetical protein